MSEIAEKIDKAIADWENDSLTEIAFLEVVARAIRDVAARVEALEKRCLSSSGHLDQRIDSLESGRSERGQSTIEASLCRRVEALEKRPAFRVVPHADAYVGLRKDADDFLKESAASGGPKQEPLRVPAPDPNQDIDKIVAGLKWPEPLQAPPDAGTQVQPNDSPAHGGSASRSHGLYDDAKAPDAGTQEAEPRFENWGSAAFTDWWKDQKPPDWPDQQIDTLERYCRKTFFAALRKKPPPPAAPLPPEKEPKS